jgi:hypothetical protein
MAVDVTSLSASRQILDRALLGTWNELLYSIEFGLSARRWSNDSNPQTHFRAKCAVALVVAFVQERNDRWQSLVIDQLGVSRSVLQLYLMHGNSVLLANLIRITQEIFLYHSENGDWPLFYGVSLRTLEMASIFDARGALPELQHGFCELWDRLVRTARNDNHPHTRSTSVRMLKRIRNVYIALHEDIDATTTTFSNFTNGDSMLDQASSYPLCNSHSHTSTLTPVYQPIPLTEAAAHTTENTLHTPKS